MAIIHAISHYVYVGIWNDDLKFLHDFHFLIIITLKLYSKSMWILNCKDVLKNIVKTFVIKNVLRLEMEALYSTTRQYWRDGQDKLLTVLNVLTMVLCSHEISCSMSLTLLKYPPHSKDIHISKASTPSSNTLQGLFTLSCSDYTYTECAMIPTA